MTMRLKADTIRTEIDQVLEILVRWKDRLSEGIPGEEIPANDMNIEIFQYQLRGEIMLASARLASIAEVLED